MSDFVKPIALALSESIEPLKIALRNEQEFELLLLQFGWYSNIASGSMQAIATAFDLVEKVDDMLAAVQELINGSTEKTQAAKALFNSIKPILQRLSSLGNTSLTGLPGPLDSPVFWNEMAEQLFEGLLVRYLEQKQATIYSVCHVLGVIKYEKVTPVGPHRVNYQKATIHWEKLIDVIGNPYEQFNKTYSWNLPGQDFNHVEFLDALQRAFLSFEIPVLRNLPRKRLADAALNANTWSSQGIKELYIPFIREVSSSDLSMWQAALIIMPIPETKTSTAAAKGLLFNPVFNGMHNSTIPLKPDIELYVKGTMNSDNLLLIKTTPSQTTFDFDLHSTELFGEIGILGEPEDPWTIIGNPTGTRLESEGFKISLEVKGSIADPEFILIMNTGEGDEEGDKKPVIRFIFQPASDGADSFISKLLGEDPLLVEFDMGLTWSSKNGILFEGQTGFEIAKSLNLDIFFIQLTTLYLQFKAGVHENKPAVNLSVGLGIKANLGPIVAMVENIGVKNSLIPLDKTEGLFGNLDLNFGLKPPNGIGLSINAGPVSGGGYLMLDFDKQEYAGVMELTIANLVSVKAIGLVTTRMPDGSKGFSMLIIITAEFNPGLQLGFGFALIGVGGLLGLNRTVLLDPLRDGVRTGAVNSIMFPSNVVENAPRIISDLKAIFPPYQDKFLIGPMAKIGWGTPTLISLSLGLIIEIPGNIAILGVLKLILPDEAAPIVKIQVAFIGTIDFGKKLLTFDASLFDSAILQTMTLEGDMALRVAWGDEPNFVLSVGGFHPAYTPPPLALPSMKRMSISILNTNIAKIRVECYQAVTSNTVQFGAKAEIKFDLKACSIQGHISFDALFQFNPFYFIISLSAGFSLRAIGIDIMTVRISMSLEGPTPWRAKGTGKVSLLFFDISANFDKTWGETKNTSLPDIHILPIFLEQLKQPEQWNSLIKAGKNLLVAFKELDEVSKQLLILHPAASLVLNQKLLPLNLLVDKIGSQKTADVKELKILSANSNDTNLKLQEVKENFARAQYQNMSDAEKLSKPAFEKLPGGVEISMGDDTIATGNMVRKVVDYELTIIDKVPFKPIDWKKYFQNGDYLFSHFIDGASVSQSILSKNYKQKLDPFEDKLAVHDELYSVVFQKDNKAFSNQAVFASEYEASQFMQQQIAEDPSLGKQLQVISQFELEEI